VPHGGLTPANFVHVAGDINASGGGSTPPPPYPQGPRFDNGQGALVAGGADYNGGGFFTGYWLTNPPGEKGNTWVGKRTLLLNQGWGFLVLANGRLDAEILKSARAGGSAADLGRKDASLAVASAQHEGFPAHTLLFLDQVGTSSLFVQWNSLAALPGFLFQDS